MKTLPAVVGNGFIWQAEKWELSSSLSWMTAFPGAMSSFERVSQGKEQIEWINGFPPKAVAVGQWPHRAEVFLGRRQDSNHQSRATSARQWRGSLRACPLSCALSRDPHRVLGTLLLATPWLGKADIFSASESRSQRVRQKQHRTATLANRFEITVKFLSRIFFWSKCSLILDRPSPFLNILLLRTSARSQRWTILGC